MNIYRLLHTIEQIIFEIAILFVFLPLTLAVIFFRPDRISSFVLNEYKKDPKERYQKRISPPLIWAIIGVLPFFVNVEMWRPEIFDEYFLTGLSNDVKIFALAAALVTGPIAFAIATLIFRHESVTNSNLERYFYAQCYIFAPFLFLLCVSSILAYAEMVKDFVSAMSAAHGFGGRESSWVVEYLFMIVLSVATLWFLIAEWFLFYHASDHRWALLRKCIYIVGGIVSGLLLFGLMVGLWLVASAFIIDFTKNI